MSFRLKLNKMDADYERSLMGELYEVQHMATARAAAVALAAEYDIAVCVVKIVEKGQNIHGEPVSASAKTVLIIDPDGTPRAPENVKMPLGIQHDPKARVCFCMNCRAERKS